MSKTRLINEFDLQDMRRGDLIDIAERVADIKDLDVDFAEHSYDDLVAFIINNKCYYVAIY